MKNDLQTEVIEGLKHRKKTSREFLRSLPPEEKIAKLVELQEQYYQMLKIREQNGGRKIPERQKKWHKARYENENATEMILEQKFVNHLSRSIQAFELSDGYVTCDFFGLEIVK